MTQDPDSAQGGRAVLAERKHWEDVNFIDTGMALDADSPTRPSRLERLLGTEMARVVRTRSAESAFWQRIVPKWINKRDPTVLELGSAPGGNLVEFRNRFNATVTGIEYSDSGAELNRRKFEQERIPKTSVIHADMFDPKLDGEFAARFDVVFSRGLVEHFRKPSVAISRHADFVAPGGVIIITIPNLHGVTGWSVRATAPELIPLHNLEIMSTRALAACASEAMLDVQFCGYFGMMDVASCPPQDSSGVRHFLYRMMKLAQLPINVIGAIGFEQLLNSSVTSPQIALVCTKQQRATR